MDFQTLLGAVTTGVSKLMNNLGINIFPKTQKPIKVRVISQRELQEIEYMQQRENR